MTNYTTDQQSRFWDDWISASSAWEVNPDNLRRAEVVLLAAKAAKHQRILEIGCGSGWLTLRLSELAKVTAVDIGVEAMKRMQAVHPNIQWIGGDFLSLDLLPGFDLIICMETISHIADQEAFAEKIATLAAPGCKLVLTTQNPLVWSRVSSLKPPQLGQLRNWPSRERLRALFEPYFDLNPIRTCAPGKGDSGFFRLLRGRGLLRRLSNGGSSALEEKFGLGCSLVVSGTLKCRATSVLT